MFCSECSTKVIENALFCHQCGAQTALSSKSGPSSASTSSCVTTTSNVSEGPKALAAGSGPPMMTFHEFRSRKEMERSSRFTSKSSSKKQKVEEKIAIPCNEISGNEK